LNSTIYIEKEIHTLIRIVLIVMDKDGDESKKLKKKKSVERRNKGSRRFE
jgi:hypothetical protein